MSYLAIKPTLHSIQGTIAVPCSKYHLHRALIFGSLAEGTTTIHGHSDAKHIQDTLNALYDLGANVEDVRSGYRVEGGPYNPRSQLVRLGSSGSTTQFLLGLGSRAAEPVTFDGVQALRNRPIGPLLNALNQLGVKNKSMNDRLPVTVFPGGPAGGNIAIQGTLSQWISGLMMAAPFAANDTHIKILNPFNEQTYIRLTTSMLNTFGIRVLVDDSGRNFTVPAQQNYRGAEIELEADFSSAAFPLVYAALHEGEVVLTDIDGAGHHPEGEVIDILQNMGVHLTIDEANRQITVRNEGIRPKGTEIDMAHIPDLIPILSVLASVSEGRTVLRNIGPGRYKESNRVEAMQQLCKMGAQIREDNDDLIIDGVESLCGAEIDVHDDHRVQMAFAVAGSLAKGETILNYPSAFEISYPEFLRHMSQLGMNIELTEDVMVKELNSSGSR
ncbi:3-phosphoshikimate 1-carboxyvinyltransferase [Alicyclobacillus sp. SO9]|uniref:3-phosphoshikimate 1-carboxyvinyltransferase n=1 Tax=Alicyclobacillus sp. SO9 TaxID=2665646 RepID=UPI0018E83E8E|nr:3-phosphoshikimate 1-carboxyvinyltransferase [Alicyclobacillus sp. SO9]QQE79857.1 3-phosphoshikimate 1-carboxyvinyltransferase [Alicyclobacillus sp. SO9]